MTILFTIGWLVYNQPGCPIRKSPDITPAYGSPRLIAVNHVLHRLSVPRHSPCALYSLTFFWLVLLTSKLNLTSMASFSQNIRRAMWSSKRFEFSFTRKNCNLFNYPFLKHCDLFKDGCHNVLSLVCLAYIVQFSRCDFRLKPELNIQFLNIEFKLQL